jgi:hypothetical protein
MTGNEAAFRHLLERVAAGDLPAVRAALAETPAFATAALRTGATRATAAAHFLAGIRHYLYAGDTALHVAAAGHRPELARLLLAHGAQHDARNRRGAVPLHHAADGRPGVPGWDPAAQAETISILLAAGADPDAAGKDGVAPLHRAVRTRSAAAVRALLAGGADPGRANKSGSTPVFLATRTTGRSGSGSPEARAGQAEILRLLEQAG